MIRVRRTTAGARLTRWWCAAGVVLAASAVVLTGAPAAQATTQLDESTYQVSLANAAYAGGAECAVAAGVSERGVVVQKPCPAAPVWFETDEYRGGNFTLRSAVSGLCLRTFLGLGRVQAGDPVDVGACDSSDRTQSWVTLLDGTGRPTVRPFLDTDLCVTAEIGPADGSPNNTLEACADATNQVYEKRIPQLAGTLTTTTDAVSGRVMFSGALTVDGAGQVGYAVAGPLPPVNGGCPASSLPRIDAANPAGLFDPSVPQLANGGTTTRGPATVRFWFAAAGPGCYTVGARTATATVEAGTPEATVLVTAS